MPPPQSVKTNLSIICALFSNTRILNSWRKISDFRIFTLQCFILYVQHGTMSRDKKLHTFWRNLMLSSNVPLNILSVLYTSVVSLTLFDVDVVSAKENWVLAPTFFVILSQGLLITTHRGIQKVYLTFRGPCIVMYSYYESQRDALFLKFIW
jgi:hypothetical protein